MVNPAIPASTALAAALAATLFVAGCSEEFAPQYLVTDLRVLAIRAQVIGGVPASLADADAGDTLRLEALLANPEGLSPVDVRWKTCLPAEGQTVPPCLDATYLADPARLDGAPGVLDLGSGPTVDVPVPPELAPALAALVERAVAEPAYACTLYLQVPVVAIATAGQRQRVALKSARLTPYREVAGTPLEGAYPPNLNPSLVAVTAGPSSGEACDAGAPAARACQTAADCGGVACLPDPAGGPGQCDDPRPSAGAFLCALHAADAVQPISQCRPDGSRLPLAEELDYQWYVTGGSFDGPAVEPVSGTGNVTDRSVSFWAPPGPYTMWVIVRDGRGGSGWLRRDYP
ncbi:MAG TPA: hypothetical protein VFR85_12975 [Anaeromyxobacteraceae bacterium]|nr:hypothetical protein [Anaeromyxobacteraceae bacterium]